MAREQPRIVAAQLKQDGKETANGRAPLWAQVLLVCAVVLFGDGNLVARQIAAKTLGRFDYVLGLVSAASYIVVYWCLLGGAHLSGAVKDVPEQLKWVWCDWNRPLTCNAGRVRPVLQLIALAALGDSVGDVLGFLCTPYVAGPVHALLAQCTTVFTAILSMIFLQRRYSLVQVASLVFVIGATAMGVVPNLVQDGANGSHPFFACVIAFSCIFNAFAFVTKELIFNTYRLWAQEQQPAPGSPSLNIFVANTAESMIQLPFTLMLLPLAQFMGQTHGDPLGSYLFESISCVFGCGEASCDHAGLATAVYVMFNISWNISILLSVKWNGALMTFVALKAIMPTSAFLFAYVKWPLLGLTPLKTITWVSLSLVLPTIAVFTYASRQQDVRAEKGKATCCWPLGAPDDDDSTEEGNETSLLVESDSNE